MTLTLLTNVPANCQNFAVSIVGLQQSWQYEGLPMVYYAPNPRSRPLGTDMGEPSYYSFFVVVQNVQKAPDRITMGASVWYDCLRFTLRTGSGKIYSVFHRPIIWSANPQEKWLFRIGGLRVIPVDFTSGSWQGLPPLDPPAEVLTMTVIFRYFDSKGKSVSVTSSPTDVYLYSI